MTEGREEKGRIHLSVIFLFHGRCLLQDECVLENQRNHCCSQVLRQYEIRLSRVEEGGGGGGGARVKITKPGGGLRSFSDRRRRDPN